MAFHSAEYRKVMGSTRWQEFKKQAIVAAGRKCQDCGEKNKLLQVHHLHYESLGCESLSDVKVLCVDCHKINDKARAEETDSNQYHRSVSNFARKKYGDDWELTAGSVDSVYQGYDDWRASKSI